MANKKEEKGKGKIKKSSYYDAKGESLGKRKKACPKCGAGIFLAEHKDRVHCGNCGFMEKLKV
ncbi:MAG TPA: 30S ribosomal protein S27ae [archaeon]|nr:30S ribosomal protein S27ae [archaeon]